MAASNEEKCFKGWGEKLFGVMLVLVVMKLGKQRRDAKTLRRYGLALASNLINFEVRYMIVKMSLNVCVWRFHVTV